MEIEEKPKNKVIIRETSKNRNVIIDKLYIIANQQVKG